MEIDAYSWRIWFKHKNLIMDDNTGYNSTQNELSRYLSPLDNSAESRISDIISVGVHGEGTQKIEKTKYNNVTAFRVPYSSKFFIDTSFNYANLIYEDWTQNLPLGKMSNSGGSILNWMVSDDSYSIKTTSDNAEHSVGTGACIIELSTDNQEWDKYRLFKFTSKKGNDIWELDGKRISKGVYVRVSYLWEIYTHWTTFERDWYNYLLFGIPIGGHNVDHYEHKNVMEISDSFYVGVDGFSQGNDFGVISIENLTESENSKYECEGFSYEELKKAETLTDGSQTNTGFKIESLYSSETYKIEVSKNGGRFLEVFSGYSSTDSGRYQIRATSKFGTQKTITIYVCSGDITENYFGEVFASKPYETSLVQGTRLFAGSNDYLKNVGINITYGWSQFPVFVNGATINIKDTSNLASLIGSITYNGLDGEKAIEVPCQKSSVSIRLKESGFYTVNLSTENSNGDITHFSANFWVVENVIGPEINKQLLTLISHESYDLIPVYYSVDMPRGPYTYIDETGKEIEKQGILRYAFSTYNSALDFSLRLEKEYTHYLGNGMFRYLNSNSPNIFLNEFELFDEMYQNAKVKVKKNYFSATNKLSMVGIDKKGIISDRGYVYYLGEESFDGNPQNAAPIVALNKSERDALTSRQNFLNNFIFISMPLDSAMVRLVSSEGKEYFIKYDIPVGEQLRAAGAKTDIYTVIETSIFGIETKYTGVYIDESEANSITINLMLDSKLKVITSEQSNIILKCKDGFTLESASDLFDKHGLICVTYNRCETPLDIATLSNVRFEQVGTYSIKVEDRFGRIYIFTIIVE